MKWSDTTHHPSVRVHVDERALERFAEEMHGELVHFLDDRGTRATDRPDRER